jgi:hypothetical protein
VAALALLSSVGVPYVTWLGYDGARNQDDAWNFDKMAAGMTAGLLWIAVIALALVAYACSPSRRSGVWLTVLSAAAISLPVLGGALGDYAWHREFDHNRRLAEEVIQAVEQHRKEHGTYPQRLDELTRSVTTKLQRGRHTHDLKYSHTGPESYVLQYGYGWYDYTYNSPTGEWSKLD